MANVVQTTLDTKQHEALKQQAQREGRTVAGMARRLLTKSLEAKPDDNRSDT